MARKEYPKPEAKGNLTGKRGNHGLMYHKRKTLGYKYGYSSFTKGKRGIEPKGRGITENG